MTKQVSQPVMLVVEAGIAGLTATIRLAEKGMAVNLLSNAPADRAISNRLNQGLSVAWDEDEIKTHFQESLDQAGYLAPQEPLMQMCRRSAALVDWLARTGVTFARTPENRLSRRVADDANLVESVFVRSGTGHAIVSALVSQIRRYEAQGLVTCWDHFDFVSSVLDDTGRCRGIVAQDLYNMEFRAFPADAVIVCTGSLDLPFGKFALSGGRQGAAALQLFQQGAAMANPEFVAWNTAGAANQEEGSISKNIMKRCSGGLWVDENRMTTLAGVFAAGDCQYLHHGAAALSTNIIPAALESALEASDRALDYALATLNGHSRPETRLDSEVKRQRDRYQFLLDLSGPENPRLLHRQLSEILHEAMGALRRNDVLKNAYRRVNELKERYLRIGISDKNSWANHEAVFARHLQPALDYAHTMILAATLRDESRGSHIKEGFPERDDTRFLKTTKMWWGKESPRLVYEELDLKYAKPNEARTGQISFPYWEKRTFSGGTGILG